MTYDLNPRVIGTDALLMCCEWCPYLIRQLTRPSVKREGRPSRHVLSGLDVDLINQTTLSELMNRWWLWLMPLVRSHSRRRWAGLSLAITAASAWEVGFIPPVVIFPIAPFDCTGQLKWISLPSSSPSPALPLLPPICVNNGVSAAPTQSSFFHFCHVLRGCPN